MATWRDSEDIPNVSEMEIFPNLVLSVRPHNFKKDAFQAELWLRTLHGLSNFAITSWEYMTTSLTSAKLAAQTSMMDWLFNIERIIWNEENEE